MKNIKNDVLDFLSSLEGYHQLLKGLHFQATTKSEHELCDDIDKAVLEYEDGIAEYTMGRYNTRFGVGDLKTMLPAAKTLEAALKELEDDTVALKEKAGDEIRLSGLHNILDELMSDISKWKYLKTFS